MECTSMLHSFVGSATQQESYDPHSSQQYGNRQSETVNAPKDLAAARRPTASLYRLDCQLLSPFGEEEKLAMALART